MADDHRLIRRCQGELDLEALAAHIALLWRRRKVDAIRTRFLHLIEPSRSLCAC